MASKAIKVIDPVLPAGVRPRFEQQPSSSAGGHTVLLHRTWSFRLAMLAWVALATKSVGVALHGLVGIIPLFGLALLIAIFEGSFLPVLDNILRNGRRNEIMVFLILWYAFGVFCKMYFWGAAETDWRGVMEPVMLIFAFIMGFGFLHEERCARSFQIALIFAIGLQSIFAGRVMLEDPTVSRAAWTEMQGRWSYGDQGGFALQAMLLPILVWRAIMEKGALRGLLVAGCGAMSVAVIACQFSTAISLLALSVPIAGFLGLIFVKQPLFRVLLVALCLLLIGAASAALLRDTALIASTVEKVERFWQDPTSGGYSEREAKAFSRWMLAKDSFDAFCQAPILGSGRGGIRSDEADQVIGKHSSLFDMLGFYGLVGGGGAFIAFVFLLLLRSLQKLQRRRDWAAVAVSTCTVLFVIGGVVNPYWEASVAMVFLTCSLFQAEEPHS